MKMKKIMEMPHVDVGKNTFDLCIEKYPMTTSEKSLLMKSYSARGLNAYHKKHKWIFIRPNKIDIVKFPVLFSYVLPEYWQDYVIGNID